MQCTKRKGVSRQKTKGGRKTGGKTRRKTGGLFDNVMRAGLMIRLHQYIHVLESRLVVKYDDYMWVKERRNNWGFTDKAKDGFLKYDNTDN